MLDGLQISEIALKDVLRDNVVFRIDSEYFKKEYLINEKTLKSVLWKYLEGCSESIKSFGAYSLCNEITYLECGVPFLRGQNIKKGFVDFIDCYHIDEAGNRLLWKSEVKPKMVLLTMSGSVGEAATALDTWTYPVNSNQDIAKITPVEGLNPHYLTSFLGSRFGNIQMQRLPVGSVQQHTFIWQLEKLVIPQPSNLFQESIESISLTAHFESDKSIRLFNDSDNLLLNRLGFTNWQPPTENTAVKGFQESFITTGRLDAEYYHEKYDYAITKLLELGSKAVVPLESLLLEITNGQTPLRHDLSEGDVVFLTAEHISDFRIDFESDKRVEIEHHQKRLAKTAIRKNDLLITIKGKIGNAAVVEDVPSPTNINQDVGLLRLKDGINPYYIAGYINSILGKMFTKRISTGQINPFLGLGNLRTIPIPIFDNAKELGASIRAKVIEAEKAAAKSKHLLAVAKRAVEIAIEQDEEAATKYVEQETKISK